MPSYPTATLFSTTVSSDGQITSAEITDATGPGVNLLTAPTVADQRTALGMTADGVSLVTATLAQQRVILGLNWGGNYYP